MSETEASSVGAPLIRETSATRPGAGGGAGLMRGMQADPNPRASARVVAEQLHALYEELDRRLDSLLSAHPGSSCCECGTCCTFPPGAPVLYATALEHAYLASEPPPVEAGLPEGACPYLERDTNFCTARERRPVGCRTHFCDEAMAEKAAREAAQDLYEWAHAEIRRISEAHGLEWNYAPVMDCLSPPPTRARDGRGWPVSGRDSG